MNKTISYWVLNVLSFAVSIMALAPVIAIVPETWIPYTAALTAVGNLAIHHFGTVDNTSP